jgi:hypothetical protein
MSHTALPEAPPQRQSSGIYGALIKRHRIRLLTLHPADDEDETVLCTLTAHDLDKRIPKFTALSYTWGSPENQKFILLNGCSISITSNLHAGLTHIREKQSIRVLWVDALCINQEDILERSRQVPLMRDIYMVAEDVLVWLGPGTESVDTCDAITLYGEVAAQPYWTRVWIIQEFVLGSKVTIQYGHLRMPWDKVDAAFSMEMTHGGQIRRKDCKMTAVFQLKRTYNTDRGLDLTEALKFSFESAASNPRDHIYGILGLVRQSVDIPESSVDYTLSPCQVYRSVLRYLRSGRYHGKLSSSSLLEKPECKDYGGVGRKQCDGRKCRTLDQLISMC